jgi:hypothetical protein
MPGSGSRTTLALTALTTMIVITATRNATSLMHPPLVVFPDALGPLATPQLRDRQGEEARMSAHRPFGAVMGASL